MLSSDRQGGREGVADLIPVLSARPISPGHPHHVLIKLCANHDNTVVAQGVLGLTQASETGKAHSCEVKVSNGGEAWGVFTCRVRVKRQVIVQHPQDALGELEVDGGEGH